MPKRRKPRDQQQDTGEKPAPENRYRVTHYGKSRHFAVYEGEDLVAVTLYRKGAEAVTTKLEDKDRKIAALESHLAIVQPAPVSPAPPSAESVQVWRPPQQLPLLTPSESRKPSRVASPRHKSANPSPRC